MSETRKLTNSTALDNSGDNYELKHILSAASAYLDSGKVSDAEDLLHEALDAVGASHPEVEALARRLDHARGGSRPSSVSASVTTQVRPDVLVNFTRPLPGVEQQSQLVQRHVRDAEGHYAARRLAAALDSTYLTCAESPGYLPGFVRLAEIQIALGKAQPARDLLVTLSHWHDIYGQEHDWLLRSLYVSLNPNQGEALSEYAISLLDAEGPTTLEPFVPQAIARSMEDRTHTARELSARYLERQPESIEVQRLHLHVLMASGDVNAYTEAARRVVTTSSPSEMLMMRAIGESTTPSDEWLGWLELAAVAVRADGAAHTAIQKSIQYARAFMSPERMSLLSGVVAFSAGQWQECADRLRPISSVTLRPSIEGFVQNLAVGIALEHLGDPSSPALMLDAMKMAFDPEIESFARTTRMFGVGVAAGDLLRAAVGNESSAIDDLRALRDAHPQRLELRAALADLYLEVGNPHEAVRELRFVAQEHEKSGNFPDMVQAMRLISSALPSNIEVKAKLIEGYLRRGVLDEAVTELGRIGELYTEKDRVDDAVAAFARGAEIATAIGAFNQGNELFEKAVEANPDDVPVRHAAVAFYLQTGSIEQATRQLREVVRIVLLTDDRDEAVAALHQIIALAPEDPEAYHKLGEVLTALGEYTQAERVYRRLATFSPHDPVLEAKQSALAVLAATK